MERRITIPPKTRELLSRLSSAGFAAYAVGGCVRDSLLGQAPQDWDICTSARPEEIIACFQRERTILTGVRYGTVTVLLDSEAFEVTTFRADLGYSDSRHPDGVRYLDTLRGDLARRDFTVNAMAYSDDEGLIDPFGGREDLLMRRVMRAVGEPERRFGEDALRILRLFRFGARLGFALEENTLRAALALRQRLARVSAERIRDELTGLLAAPAPAAYLPEEIAAIVLPELVHSGGFAQAMRRVDAADMQVRLAALLADLGDGAQGALHRLHFDNRTIASTAALVRLAALEPCAQEAALLAQARRLLGEIGPVQVERLALLRAAQRAAGEDRGDLSLLLAQARAAAARGDCCRVAELAVGGRELSQALGRAPGPWTGRMLTALLARVIGGTLPNEQEALLAAARDDEKITGTRD